MSYAFNSRLGEQLYWLLPEVYRTRDKKAEQVGASLRTEDLAKYLDTHGHLLDLIHATLQQQFDDALPESSQDWLLPYFAQLLAAKIVSPDSKGKTCRNRPCSLLATTQGHAQMRGGDCRSGWADGGGNPGGLQAGGHDAAHWYATDTGQGMGRHTGY